MEGKVLKQSIQSFLFLKFKFINFQYIIGMRNPAFQIFNALKKKKLKEKKVFRSIQRKNSFLVARWYCLVDCLLIKGASKKTLSSYISIKLLF